MKIIEVEGTKIIGIEGMAYSDIREDVKKGGVFVVYKMCFSVIFLTLVVPTEVYYIKAGHSRFWYGVPSTFISLLFGWWGFPWGPIRTIQCIANNMRGGKNLTRDLLNSLSYSSIAEPLPPPVPRPLPTERQRRRL